MMYYYDINGWHTSEVLEGRGTEIAPPTKIPAGMAANFTGHKWLVVPYVAPPEIVMERIGSEESLLLETARAVISGDTAKLREMVARVEG